MKTNLSEKEIEREILHWLNISGYFAWKNQSVGIFDPTRKVFRSKGTFDISGVSDIIAIKHGDVFFIEVKSETGRQSDSQKAFETKLKSKGGRYILTRSLEELRKTMEEYEQSL